MHYPLKSLRTRAIVITVIASVRAQRCPKILIGSRRDRLHAIFPFLGSQPGGVRSSGQRWRGNV